MINYCLLALRVIAALSVLSQPVSSETFHFGRQLEQAIYQQEVRGELREAIVSYQTILDQVNLPDIIQAEALYRTAQCHHLLGEKDLAEKLWQHLVDDMPQQTRFVNLALGHLGSEVNFGLPLIDVPWQAGEILNYELIRDGKPFFLEFRKKEKWEDQEKWTLYTTISHLTKKGKPHWEFEYSTREGSVTAARYGGFQWPGYELSLSGGNISVFWHKHKRIRNAVIEKNRAPLSLYRAVLRRYPFNIGTQFKLPLIKLNSLEKMRWLVKVIDEETVQVPAGTFDTYKIEIQKWQSRQWQHRAYLWLDKGPNRYIVKDTLDGERLLTRIGHPPAEPHYFESRKHLYGLHLPPRWRAHALSWKSSDISAFFIEPFNKNIQAYAQTTVFDGVSIDRQALKHFMDSHPGWERERGFIKRYQNRDEETAFIQLDDMLLYKTVSDHTINGVPLVDVRLVFASLPNIVRVTIELHADQYEEYRADIEAISRGFYRLQTDSKLSTKRARK